MFRVFLLMILTPPLSTLFPYTTLFRSSRSTETSGPTSTPGISRRSAPSRVKEDGLSQGSSRPTGRPSTAGRTSRSEEHTSELQSHHDLVCRLLLEKKKKTS